MKVKSPPTPPPCPHCRRPQVRDKRGKLYCRPCSAKRMKGRVAAPKETAECERCGDEFLRRGSAKLRAVNCPRCRNELARAGEVHEPSEAEIYLVLCPALRAKRAERVVVTPPEAREPVRVTLARKPSTINGRV